MYKMEKPFIWEPGLIFLHKGYNYPGTSLSSKASYKLNYEKHWFEDPFNIKCVTEIDKMKMLMPGIFEHDLFGCVNYEQISGGAKTLILLNMVDNIVLPMSQLGDNCADLLYELSLKKPVHLYYEVYLLHFNPKQKVLYFETGDVFTEEEASYWERFMAPDWDQILED